MIAARFHHISRENSLLGLVLVLLVDLVSSLASIVKPNASCPRITYVKHKDKEVRLLSLASKLLLCLLDVLLELANRILQSSPGVVDLIYNKDVLANEICHLQRTEVQPLCPSHLGSRNLFGVATAKILIERKTDGLDRNVRFASTLEERPIKKSSQTDVFSQQQIHVAYRRIRAGTYPPPPIAIIRLG
jgi:hypothetical protein